MSDLERIYLQPDCCADYAGVGRLWCEDDVFTSECDDGIAATEYVRADLLKAKDKRIAELDAVYKAADALKDDMIMRADIGTYDGDHSVQAGNTVWYNFCEALAAAKENDDE